MDSNTLLISATVGMAGIMAYREASGRWKAYTNKREAETSKRALDRAHRDEQQGALVGAMQSFVRSMENHAINEADAKNLMAGTMKACEAIAAATVELRGEVAAFGKLVGGPKPDANYPEDNLIPPADEQSMDRVHQTFASILAGMPVKQAEQEAADDEEKKTMLSAISLGPED